MEEKTITLTCEQLSEYLAKAVSNIVNDEHAEKESSLMIVLISALINAELCRILFDEPEKEQNHDA